MPKHTSLRLIFLLLGFSLMIGLVAAQGSTRAVVINEFANIRIAPALGADVIDTVSAGYEFDLITGRSGDDEWIRVIYQGYEGWVNLAPLAILEGNVLSLPVADPRTIPYGGFEAPRSGPTSATAGGATAVTTAGLRLRAGPSTAYPTLANIPYNFTVPVTGRMFNNTWYQVIFEGTLGWVSGTFLQFTSGNPAALTVDGLVADAAPPSQPTAENYIATLRFMRDRLDRAQQSLDDIRGSWADAALNGRAVCQEYPARPSDLHIATPLLAAYYPTLNPLLNDFNDAMFNVRHAIDLFIEVCNQPGTGNPVGTATVQGALGTVNLADSQFTSIRNRLNELIPPDLEVGEGQCLLSYGGQAELLPLVNYAEIYLDDMDPKDTVKGYCFDALEGQILLFETLQLGNSNLVHFLSISPLDNPTDFVAIGRGNQDDPKLSVSPVRISQTGRYLLILSEVGEALRTEPPIGDYAFVILDITTANVNPQLVFDPETGAVTVQVPAAAVDTTGGGGGVEEDPFSTQEAVVCPGLDFSCNQLFTCEEAYACLAAGNFVLDADEDGIPCEETLCSP